MTNEQIVQVIAESEGWKDIIFSGDVWGINPETGYQSKVKHYLTSHDAIIPAVVKWSEKQPDWGGFIQCLKSVKGMSSFEYLSPRDLLTATPEQLAIALVKAMGKWEE